MFSFACQFENSYGSAFLGILTQRRSQVSLVGGGADRIPGGGADRIPGGGINLNTYTYKMSRRAA